MKKHHHQIFKASTGEVRVEFGLLFGLFAVFSFFAVPFVQNFLGQDDPTASGLPTSNVTASALQAMETSSKSHASGQTSVRALDPSALMRAGSVGHATNVTSVDGVQWNRAATQTQAKAEALDNIAARLQNEGQASPALANQVSNLAREAKTLAEAQQHASQACQHGTGCNLQAVGQAQAALQKALKSVMASAQNSPGVLSPELKAAITREASEILKINAGLNAAGQEIDLHQAEALARQCAGAQDPARCIEEKAGQ